MNEKIERRYMPAAELRIEEVEENGTKKKKIAGYASVFNSPSVDLGGFREIVKPGAFDRNFGPNGPTADVRALVDHDPSKILGRTKSGTLSLSVRSKGLYVEIDPPDTQVARDLMKTIERGDVDAMSFGFRTHGDKWGKKDGETIRELTDVELFDVSAVTFPAYPDTQVALRSLDLFQKENPEDPAPQAPEPGVQVSVRRRQLDLLDA
jgi:HK97 family phage prohead protease